MSMNVILNADDFGKSESINAAIAQCFAQGLITSTTLMVNMPFADQAVALARRDGFLDRVGLHLNLTEGRPLHDGLCAIPLVCDADGTMRGVFHDATRTRLAVPRQVSDAMRTELSLQIQKFLAYKPQGKLHADSHHHVHTDWCVLRVLRPLLFQHGFDSLRLGRNMGHMGRANECYKAAYNRAVRSCVPHTTDLFGDFADFLDSVPSLALGGGRTVELMCHPDFAADGTLVNRWTRAGAAESFSEVHGHLRECSLISFNDL